MDQEKKTKRPFGKYLSIFLIIAFLGVGGHYLYTNWYGEYLAHKARLAYEEELRNRPPEATPSPSPSPIPTPTPTASPTPEPTPEPLVVRPEFLALIEETGNEDIVGMLTIPGTSINYPVVQSDDNIFYLERNIQKQKDANASIYMDYENDITKDDANTILYGHNMNADKMFHALRYWRDKDFFDKNRFITFNTLYKDQTWEVFSFYKTNVDFNYIQVIFNNDEEFFELAQEMQRRSMHPTDIVLTKEERILTLSTCSNQEEDTRLVLNARLVQE